jgi:hypothetical protein
MLRGGDVVVATSEDGGRRFREPVVAIDADGVRFRKDDGTELRLSVSR